MDKKPEALPLSTARSLLRGASLRCTACRIAVLQQLAEATSPISHADVSDKLVPLGYDKSTIYRSLVELSDVGIATRLDLGDHVWRFELKRDDDHVQGQHPHFMCVDCGKVSCLPDVTVNISAHPAAHAEEPELVGAGASHGITASSVDITEVLLKGHCGDCR